MADIVKKISTEVPKVERSQSFDHNDAVEGDVLMFKDSLGKPATHLVVEAGDAMAFRLNVYHTVFPVRKNDIFASLNPGQVNLTSGIQVMQSTSALFQLSGLSTFTLDNDMPVNDMHLVTVSGIFNVIAI